MQPGACRHLFAMLSICALALVPIRAAAEETLVFAAASLKTALDEIATDFEEQSGQDVTISYAASSVLARQIQLGAPADVFISANVEWMDYLEDHDRIEADSRIDLLGNGLVLIGGSGQSDPGELSADYDLQSELKDGYLAMALVDAVPAGIYGKTALQNLGLWDGVQGKVAQTDNVRAALALVATGASPLGIVYRSDAQAEEQVRVVGTIPSGSHAPIIYPAAMTKSAAQGAQDFLSYLQSEEAQAIFLEQGFSLPGAQ